MAATDEQKTRYAQTIRVRRRWMDDSSFGKVFKIIKGALKRNKGIA